jgi:predicted nucleic acid-binding protein
MSNPEKAVLLDSVILIDLLNGLQEARTYVQSVRRDATVSVITRAEVLVGTENREEERAARLLLDRFPCFPITVETANRTARLRRRHGWHLPDAFQAALAHEHDCRLATRNTKDFDPNAHAFVHVPYRLSAP